MTLEERVRQLENAVHHHKGMLNASNLAIATLASVIGSNPSINKQQLFDVIASSLRQVGTTPLRSSIPAMEMDAIVDETREGVEVILSLIKTFLGLK